MTDILLATSSSPDIITAAKTMFGKIYTDIAGIFTLLCVVALSACLIGMMFCKNGKVVEECREWRNRIIISWIVFNCLGSIFKYGEDLTSNTKWTATS